MGAAESLPEALGTQTDEFLCEMTKTDSLKLFQKMEQFSDGDGLVDADVLYKICTHDTDSNYVPRRFIIQKTIEFFTKSSNEKDPKKVDFINFVKTLVAFLSPGYEQERELQLKRM